MKCPACKGESERKMRCIRTRFPDPTVTRRTYLCASCKKRFLSTEILDEVLPVGWREILHKPRLTRNGLPVAPPPPALPVVPAPSSSAGKDSLASIKAVGEDDNDDGEWDDFEEDWENGEDFLASGGADWYDGDDDWDDDWEEDE